MENHPYFNTRFITASEERFGKLYGETVNWLIGGDIPSYAKKIKVESFDIKNFKKNNIKIVFSALPPDVALKIEKELAYKGYYVFSNSRAYRYNGNVPILIPEVNPEHINIIKNQLKTQKGFIITNANCSTTGLVLALRPLLKFGISKIIVSTYQALSGAGYPGVPSIEINGNVIPYIPDEEEKIKIETNKILGRFTDNKIISNNLPVFANCVRVPVRDGHLESVVIEFEKEIDINSIKKSFRNLSSIKDLPTSPIKPIILREEENRPQPILDVNAGQPERAKGMSITIGRIKKQEKQVRFFLLVHNTIRGAAGNSVLNAEYALKSNFLLKGGNNKK